jgi:hypothetical protein
MAVWGGEIVYLSNSVNPKDFQSFFVFTVLPLTFVTHAGMLACLSADFGVRYREEDRKWRRTGRCRDVEISEESLKTEPYKSCGHVVA